MGLKFWISGIVAAVVFFLLGFVVHELILHDDYAQIVGIFRTPEEALGRMPFMMLADLLMGFAAAWIYRQASSVGTSWMVQGIKFGLAFALLSSVPMYLIYYVIQPWPGPVVVKQVVLQTLVFVVVGIVLAWINRPKAVE